MNTTSRLITGTLIIILSILFIGFAGFVDGPGIDFWAILTGVLFFILGVFILFNRGEDRIEGRKDKLKFKKGGKK